MKKVPNYLTTARMIMVVLLLGFVLFPFERLNWDVQKEIFFNIPLINLIIFIIFITASFTDFLDGYIARKYNAVTNFGKLVDPIADKLLINVTLIIFLAKGDIHFIIVALFIFRDIMMDGLRMLALEKSLVIPASITGKLKTVLQMIALSFVILQIGQEYFIPLILLLLALFVSITSMIEYYYKAIPKLKNSSISKQLFDLLLANNKTISIVESLTGGLASSSIVENSNASAVLVGSLVTYQTESKVTLLNQPADFFQEHGTISSQTAELMAKKALEIFKSDYALSFTGNAGPSAIEGKNVGDCYIGIASKNLVVSYFVNLKGKRNQIRRLIIEEGFTLLFERLKEKLK